MCFFCCTRGRTRSFGSVTFIDEPVARSGAIFLGQTNPNPLCAEDIPLPMIEFDKYSEKEVIQQQRFLARLRLAIERGMVHCTRVVI